MAGPVLQVEVVSREGRLWHGLGTHVQAPATDGSIGILPRRQPLLATLGPGTLVVSLPEGGTRSFQVNGGFISVDSDYVTVVAEHGSVA